MAKKLIAANWKENPGSEKKAIDLFRGIAGAKHSKRIEVALCPPFIYLEKIAEIKKRERHAAALGAQDVFWEEKGPYTSEVGPKMLRSLGVKYVIIGHSERRRWMQETDFMINKKIKSALKGDLQIILCVGESLAVRKKGISAARAFVAAQLKKDLAGIPKGRNVVVAYEPIWAIGSGKSDTPEDAREMAIFIKDAVKRAHGFVPRLLYGGSVNSRNIRDYVQWKEMDGALVGGASLKADEFKKIINL